MRRILSVALVAFIAPMCVHAQSTTAVVASSNADASASVAKSKPKSPFGAVMAELTRAAQEQAANSHKPTAAQASTSATSLPAPPRASAKTALADSSGG
ncbi:hypothetical protein [Lysobacter sp. HA35]